MTAVTIKFSVPGGKEMAERLIKFSAEAVR
jgi:hypothetical protein